MNKQKPFSNLSAAAIKINCSTGLHVWLQVYVLCTYFVHTLYILSMSGSCKVLPEGFNDIIIHMHGVHLYNI